jgi:hypothetical protein
VDWWLGTITPCVIIAYLVLLHLACRLKPLRRLFRWIAVPFTDFIALEDLFDPTGKTVQPPVWKRRIFVVLPAMEALSWIAVFFYTLLASDSPWLSRSGVSAVLWVRIQRVFSVRRFLILIADSRAALRSDLFAPPLHPHISYSFSVLRLSSQQSVTCTSRSPDSRSRSGTHYLACSGQLFHSSYFHF